MNLNFPCEVVAPSGRNALGAGEGAHRGHVEQDARLRGGDRVRRVESVGPRRLSVSRVGFSERVTGPERLVTASVCRLSFVAVTENMQFYSFEIVFQHFIDIYKFRLDGCVRQGHVRSNDVRVFLGDGSDNGEDDGGRKTNGAVNIHLCVPAVVIYNCF